MKTINNFTEEEINEINSLNESFVSRLKEAGAGSIKNEDSFEKSGLYDKLVESPEFLAEFRAKALRKFDHSR